MKERTIACIKMLCLPLNSSEAGGQLLAGDFMMRNALTALSMTRTVFRTRAIYVVMWAGHRLFEVEFCSVGSEDIHKFLTD